MKKLFVTTLIFLLIAGPSSLLYAGEAAVSTDESVASYRLQVGEKAARGAKNILFGWTEIPKRVVDLTKETNNPIWGVLAGTYQGTLKAVARTASGASDVITAPISPDKAPLIQSEIDVQ